MRLLSAIYVIKQWYSEKKNGADRMRDCSDVTVNTHGDLIPIQSCLSDVNLSQLILQVVLGLFC